MLITGPGTVNNWTYADQGSVLGEVDRGVAGDGVVWWLSHHLVVEEFTVMRHENRLDLSFLKLFFLYSSTTLPF